MSSLFPELCVTGYTCADLFGQSALLEAGIRAVAADRPRRPRAGAQLVVVGRADPRRQQPVQLRRRDRRRRDPGDRPQAVSSPTTRSSTRAAGSARPTAPSRPRSSWHGRRVPFGIDLLFEARGRRRRRARRAFVVGVEICEDLWVPVPPSSLQAMAGATILLNLSASNETIGKSRYRTDLVVGQSGRCDRRLCHGRRRAVRVDDRRGLRRPLPDRRERPAAGRVAPGRRRPADPPRLVRDHPGRRRRQAAQPIAAS